MSSFTVDTPRDFLLLQQEHLLSQLVSIRVLLEAQDSKSYPICDVGVIGMVKLQAVGIIDDCCTALVTNESMVSLSETLVDVSEDAAPVYKEFNKNEVYEAAAAPLQHKHNNAFKYLLSSFEINNSDNAWKFVQECTVAKEPHESSSIYSDTTKKSSHPPTGSDKLMTGPLFPQLVTTSIIRWLSPHKLTLPGLK